MEVAAALAVAVRDDRMVRAEARAVETRVHERLGGLHPCQLDERHARAGGLAWRHGLRGYNAVQLVALAWRELANATERPFVFACFDNDPRRAAAIQGLTTWPE